MAGPASAAATAASAISFGVIGRYGDIDGVWMAPVTAQVMITLRCALIVILLHRNLVRMPCAGATQAGVDRASACGPRAPSRPVDRRARPPPWRHWHRPPRRAARGPQ